MRTFLRVDLCEVRVWFLTHLVGIKNVLPSVHLELAELIQVVRGLPCLVVDCGHHQAEREVVVGVSLASGQG